MKRFAAFSMAVALAAVLLDSASLAHGGQQPKTNRLRTFSLPLLLNAE